ncbi:MAG: riboflavin biosynthesis protein RibF [Candidatus Omnitrophica bacterium]|nr:riboflavin biosynthesis protein RibF [Candidatus Omnitrophota bacterium]
MLSNLRIFMKVIYGSGRLPRSFKRSVVAIGVFDSVHVGHQNVIRRAVLEARRLKCVSVVLTFDPHPVSVLRPKEFSSYVLTLEHRLKLIAALGVDYCVVLRFNTRMARQSPEKFIHDILMKRLHAQKVLVGKDFHFGCKGVGNIAFLRAEGRRLGFDVEAVPIFKLNNINIKTNIIKGLIREGKLSLLKRFLGRDHSFLAEVVGGDKRGRRLGYPTANLKKENVTILPSGIYCARVLWRAKKLNALLYIGTRKTFYARNTHVVLEVFILDFHQDIYGQDIDVLVLKKIRDDAAFSDGESLALQIQRDVAAAQKYFTR